MHLTLPARVRYLLFDMDGTLLDSMHFWRGALVTILRRRNCAGVTDALLQKINFMASSVAIPYLNHTLHPDPPIGKEDIFSLMREFYLAGVPTKPGVLPFLAALRERGVKMCILSATPAPMIPLALRASHLADYFDFILSADDYPGGKNSPKIFLDAMRRFGAAPQACGLVEDALYSIRTGKQLGLYCVGIYDASSADDQTEIQALCDEYHAHSFED